MSNNGGEMQQHEGIAAWHLSTAGLVPLWASGAIRFLLDETIPWAIRLLLAVITGTAYHYAFRWVIRRIDRWLGQMSSERKGDDDV